MSEEEFDACSECGAVFDSDAYLTEYEYRGECHGAPAYENTVVGYVCPECGHKGKL